MTNENKLEKKAGILTGRYWIPAAGPLLIVKDKSKNKPMIGASEEYGPIKGSFLVYGYLAYQGVSGLAAGIVTLMGINELVGLFK
jgi:hypothetical protein